MKDIPQLSAKVKIKVCYGGWEELNCFFRVTVGIWNMLSTIFITSVIENNRFDEDGISLY